MARVSSSADLQNLSLCAVRILVKTIQLNEEMVS